MSPAAIHASLLAALAATAPHSDDGRSLLQVQLTDAVQRADVTALDHDHVAQVIPHDMCYSIDKIPEHGLAVHTPDCSSILSQKTGESISLADHLAGCFRGLLGLKDDPNLPSICTVHQDTPYFYMSDTPYLTRKPVAGNDDALGIVVALHLTQMKPEKIWPHDACTACAKTAQGMPQTESRPPCDASMTSDYYARMRLDFFVEHCYDIKSGISWQASAGLCYLSSYARAHAAHAAFQKLLIANGTDCYAGALWDESIVQWWKPAAVDSVHYVAEPWAMKNAHAFAEVYRNQTGKALPVYPLAKIRCPVPEYGLAKFDEKAKHERRKQRREAKREAQREAKHEHDDELGDADHSADELGGADAADSQP